MSPLIHSLILFPMNKPFPPSLEQLINFFTEHFQQTLTHLVKEEESAAYDAYQFRLNKQYGLYRHAKITPKKIGQFVTLWNRNAEGITQPFNENDAVDWVIISAEHEEQWGFFLFPKAVLVQHKILRTSVADGKRGFRIYPPWDAAENAQAKKTQAWQLRYFLGENTLDAFHKIFAQ